MSEEAHSPVALPAPRAGLLADWGLAGAGRLLVAAAIRIATIAGQLFVVSIIIFVVLRLIPTDPLAMMIPADASREEAENIRTAYGFNRPIYEQYLLWLGNALQGDLGNGIQAREPVTRLIRTALPMTLVLAFFGLLLGVVLGAMLGILTFRVRGTRLERVGEGIASLAQSIPEFLWGITFVLIFGLALGLFPFIGPMNSAYVIPKQTGFLFIDTLLAGRFDAFRDHLWHLVMPVVALSMMKIAMVMRVLRSSLVEVYLDEYVNAARLRGVSENAILFRHALRNAAIPTVALIGVSAAQTFGGTLLIEAIYSLPGLGNLMIVAIRTNDLPLIQGICLTYCAIVLLVNNLVDLSYFWLNPRLRKQ